MEIVMNVVNALSERVALVDWKKVVDRVLVLMQMDAIVGFVVVVVYIYNVC